MAFHLHGVRTPERQTIVRREQCAWCNRSRTLHIFAASHPRLTGNLRRSVYTSRVVGSPILQGLPRSPHSGAQGVTHRNFSRGAGGRHVSACGCHAEGAAAHLGITLPPTGKRCRTQASFSPREQASLLGPRWPQNRDLGRWPQARLLAPQCRGGSDKWQHAMNPIPGCAPTACEPT